MGAFCGRIAPDRADRAFAAGVPRGGPIRRLGPALAKRIMSRAKRQAVVRGDRKVVTFEVPPRSPSSTKSTGSAEEHNSVCSEDPSLDEDEVCTSKSSLADYFDVEELQTLGQGAFGVVSLGVHRLSQMERAVKTIELRNSYVTELTLKEVDILRDMDHPNILRFFNAYHEENHVHIISELCRGGMLFDRVVDAGYFCERNAAIVMQQAFSAVFYLHCRNIVHRDLKAENFLFLSDAPIESNTLKLIDFGLATHLEPGAVLEAKVGSAEYMAPQVWKGKYDKQCDLWSLGVIAFVLLSGRFPFGGDSRKMLRESVLSGRWNFRGKCWELVSEEAKDLIRSLLAVSPKSRISAEEALVHEWVCLKTRSTSICRALDPCLVESLKATQKQARLKQAILRLIVAWVDVDDAFEDLRLLFAALDANKDGVLTRAELGSGLAHLGLGEADLESNLDAIMSGRGQIEYTEFLSASLYQGNFLTEELAMKVFKCLDADGDGVITLEDLERCKRRTLPTWMQTRQAPSCSEASLDLLREASLEGLDLDFVQFRIWLGAYD
jgi:calcium-dependent protein kinase